MSTFETEAIEYRSERLKYWNNINASAPRAWSDYYRKKITSTYCQLIPENSRILELGCGQGDLLNALKPSLGLGIDFSKTAIDRAKALHTHIEFIQADAQSIELDNRTFDYIIISELVNDVWDVQTLLYSLKKYCTPSTRIIFNFYSHLWNIPLAIASKIGMASPKLPQNWLAPQDMKNLLEISGFQPLRHWTEVLLPIHIPFISDFSNRYLAKLFPFRYLAMSNFMVARPQVAPKIANPSASVIVAARNESGHINELMKRIPQMGAGTEIIFVEGHSSDDTYDVIEREIAAHPNMQCKLIKQPGKGKGDAVRAGFDLATGDVLMVLDADITVPPEDLPRFFDLMANGDAEFVNGVRLVYPMEGDAMRFANLIGNKFFSWAFSWLLGQSIRDTLCGTKVLWREDYQRIAQNRSYFGDFDPFGDFDLLFGAARLNLKILEVPIRYRARRYGETNISRWKHGFLLLTMGKR